MSADEDSIENEIFEWAVSLPSWQQDMVVRLLESPDLSEAELEILEQRVLASVDLANEPNEPSQEATAERFSTSTADLVDTINSIGQLNGVGMIDSEQVIEFADEGLTVVYGRNGSGKSSFARTLKYLGRATGSPPQIHSNVREGPPEDPPTATIAVQVSGSREEFDVSLADPAPEACSSIRAFDSRSSTSTVSQRNRVDFTPRILEIFDRLATTQKRVDERITAKVASLEEQRPDLSEFSTSTDVSAALDALSHETDFAEIENLAAFSDEDAVELASLKDQLARTPDTTESLAQEKDRSRNESLSAAGTIDQIEALVSDASIDERNELSAEADRKSKTAESVENRVFAEAPLPDLSPDAWRELWAAAESYVKSGSRDYEFPPNIPNEKCPLCYQHLDDEASARFKSFNEYLKDETARAASDARRELSENKERLVEPLPVLDGEALARICGADSDLKEKVESFIARAEDRYAALSQDPLTIPKVELPESPAPELRSRADDLESQAKKLREEIDSEEFQKARDRRDLLIQRSTLKDRLDDLRDWHATLGEIAKHREAVQKLGTAAITRKCTQLSEKVIDETFAQALRDELNGLRLDHLEVDFKQRGTQGASTIEIVLPDAVQSVPIADVLSEGEQRAIGLATFLAGLVPEGSNGPLVIDDPVSSFDEDRREAAAKRLAAEARQRQVVVFTHDIAFAHALDTQARAQAVPIKIIGLTKKGATFGHVEPDGPVETQNAKQACVRLEGELRDYPYEGTTREQLKFADSWYPDLRRAWERAVEMNLLQGIVKRFERPVRTNKLDQVNLTDDLRAAVREGMTRSSRFPHSAPDTDPQSPPTKQEMKDDVKALRDFVDLVNKG